MLNMARAVQASLAAVTLLAGAWSTAAAAAGAGAVRIEHITDPTLNNMVAFDVRVPASWHYQGTLVQGGPCVGLPGQVFRLTSPDGLSFLERMPLLGWYWGTGPAEKVKTTDCLPLKGAMTAQDFLKYLASTMSVEYVADDPVPAADNAAAQKSVQDAAAAFPARPGASMPQSHQTIELAQAIVRYKNGSFKMKGLLQASVLCMETRYPGMKSILKGMADRPPWSDTKCQAGVRYTVAPEEKFQATLELLAADKVGASVSPAWNQAWMTRTQQQGAAMAQQIADQGARNRAASAAQFNHDQAVRQQMHEQFLSTMQRGTDQSMARAAQIANTNHTIASDWVDYSLDRQTVRDPNSGQVSKVSSGYNATWVDASGKVSYQTNDPNANPNGTLPGNWTRQQVVHGDGTP
jgi:hypothetical protein